MWPGKLNYISVFWYEQNIALYSILWRYIRTDMSFSKEEADFERNVHPWKSSPLVFFRNCQIEKFGRILEHLKYFCPFWASSGAPIYVLSGLFHLWRFYTFLGVGKNFRLLMQSCCFFFSRPFHENFKFLKNCPYDFYEILHSHSTPKGAPACAKASKLYDWDVRNIAKISPKMAKKQPFLDFFRFSQKLSIRFERNFLYLFYTILESYMCNGIKIVWLGCEKHSQI